MAGSPYPSGRPSTGDSTLVAAERTGGRLAVLVRDLAPGHEPPLRRHAVEDLVYVVLEGEVVLEGPDGASTAGPDAVLHVPPATAHRCRAITAARVLVLAVPGGAEPLLLHEGRLAEEDPALLLALAQEHRVELLPGLLP
jgi:quercetin dioxygenase-like cupin family protein